jgi:hypothetical protein
MIFADPPDEIPENPENQAARPEPAGDLEA